MQNTSLEDLISDSTFQVNCYGEYLRIATAAERASKGHIWQFMKRLHEAHGTFCRRQAQAHLHKHLEIEAKIRELSHSTIIVTTSGIVDVADIQGL